MRGLLSVWGRGYSSGKVVFSVVAAPGACLRGGGGGGGCLIPLRRMTARDLRCIIQRPQAVERRSVGMSDGFQPIV